MSGEEKFPSRNASNSSRLEKERPEERRGKRGGFRKRSQPRCRQIKFPDGKRGSSIQERLSRGGLDTEGFHQGKIAPLEV